MEQKVRVRFAPSPTGPLHIGGVRTALYNFLFAKKNNGEFILRIEDTDQGRYVPGAEDYIIESLSWCGIRFDEGVHVGGQFAPYRQSERKEIYKQYADYLVEKGFAYYAFDAAPELEAKRKEYEQQKKTFQYGIETRMAMKNSLSLDKSDIQKKLESNEPYVIRMRIPENEKIKVNDLIRGEVVVDTLQLDDKVLYKSDGMPTYHLANVVDDYLMKITHVIRGEEWLPSAPLHVLLYKCLGWENAMPQFAHLPLLLKPDGNGKLSKRDGDKLGFPVFPLRWTDPFNGEVSSGYRESGYFPEAVVNMLALLGWNPGTEQELFSMDELINSFSLERVGKSGSKFDFEKAKWFNHQYLMKQADEDLLKIYKTILKENDVECSDDHALKVMNAVKERVNFPKELWNQSSFFFKAPESYDEKSVKDKWKENSSQILEQIIPLINEATSFEANLLKEKVSLLINEKQWGMGHVMNALRICLVGASAGPDLFLIIEMLGKEETVSRIKRAIEKIKK
ncbi:MAG TPA: glutamate--tRNA ligase [Bacteroidales bacterium]|nr:glutamate--tRNA ligase [Bacteroidales bacterium]HPS15899.1 glutamate--tRNA ligase [Bacteroidales bacterium]